MRVVIPFADCVARPDLGGVRFSLAEHLEAVARGCGRLDGAPEERLAFLAGLLHDAAKAAPEWQHYIRGGARWGPPHAPLGSALFAFWADDLVSRWASADRLLCRRLFDLALDWARVVYDHHGGLDDLTADPPWLGPGGTGMRELFASLDHAGLTALVKRFFPDARDLSGFPAWLDRSEDRWRQRWQFDRARLLRDAQRVRPGDDVPLAREGLRLAELGALLVFADRSHAAEWEPEDFPSAEAGRAASALVAHLETRAEKALAKDKAKPELVDARGRLNSAALDGYRAHCDAAVFALLLPTGFGKTLTGLRVALEACRTGRCRRVVYVAPYLSILSQAAKEMAEATGQEVFVHHHLTAATLEDHQPYDALDTWQVPILATTFNQLFRALFPARAQQCLRRPALDGAFVLIDEPQIIGKEVWNLFLRALAVACREQRCQALLMTATLPPADAGLGAGPVELVPRAEIGTLPTDRYVIQTAPGEWKAAEAAEEARRRFDAGGSVAIILNTVRDACDVYRRVVGGGHPRWRFLAAAMLPGHKAKVIADLRRMLKRNDPGEPKSKPVGVVCTQVLEAGVDLSFRSLLRALPILPSVVQAAGRANRHGAVLSPAEVVVFDYRRDDGKQSRQYIYTSENARGQTDAVLAERTPLNERDVPAALEEYFRRLWAVEPATACLGRFERSARGEWSALAGLVPFDGDDAWKAEVFVPHPQGERFLPLRMARLLDRFAPNGPQELLKRYQDVKFRQSLSRRDRKRFSTLLRQFAVALPRSLLDRVARRTEMDWLWELNDTALYSDATGLAHLLGEAEDDPSCAII